MRINSVISWFDRFGQKIGVNLSCVRQEKRKWFHQCVLATPKSRRIAPIYKKRKKEKQKNKEKKPLHIST